MTTGIRITRKLSISMNPKYHIDKRALFCDETAEYRFPAEPECNQEVTIRFRTAKDNVDQVYLIYSNTEVKMEKVETAGRFDYYQTKLTVKNDRILYYFEINLGKETCFYNKLGPTADLQAMYHFSITPGFHTPEWAKGAVFYQIFVDRFCNGEQKNDPVDREYAYIGGHCVRVTDWEKYPEAFDVRCFYGGDLQGVRQKLDYLQELGVEVIYFNPLFVSPSNHKYDIQDYDYIDPHFGIIEDDCEELLAEGDLKNKHARRYIKRVASKKNLEASNAYFADLVEEIHKRDMKVILDGVFNHCGSFNKWLDREQIYEHEEGYEPGAYIAKDSPYHNFFSFHSDHWPYNKDYDGWWGHDTLPKLNYEDSPEVEEYVLNIGRKWVSAPYNIDGWRLDVAADLGHSVSYNHEFWRKFRQAVKEINPNAIILAEHYGDPSSWLEGDQWDTVMNYDAFMEPITWFLTGIEKHSDHINDQLYGNSGWFFNTMRYNMSKFQRQSLDVAMNELSNHDHSRFLTRTNRRVGRTASLGPRAAGEGVCKGVFREAVVMQMTWPGAPTVYYGDEAGQVGWTDPDNRRTYPWGKEDWELIEFHKYMIGIHKKYRCLRLGSYKDLLGEYQLVVYGRFCKEDAAVIIINNAEYYRTVSVPIWEINLPENGVMTRVMQTGRNGYNVGHKAEGYEEGYLVVEVPPISATVYVMESK